MRRDTFALILGRFNNAKPFENFTVELQNRLRGVSRHPEAITCWRGDLTLFVDIDGANVYFDASCVVRVVDREVPHGAE